MDEQGRVLNDSVSRIARIRARFITPSLISRDPCCNRMFPRIRGRVSAWDNARARMRHAEIDDDALPRRRRAR